MMSILWFTNRSHTIILASQKMLGFLPSFFARLALRRSRTSIEKLTLSLRHSATKTATLEL